MNVSEFQERVWQYYREHGRTHLPWREHPTPYRVLVSELMLQQTQVERVIPKFNAFMAAFPTVEQLAAAPLAEVLRQWQGLGYNRRARYVHEAAKAIIRHGKFPDTTAGLIALPGIGPNTAAAIEVYAFEHVAFFVETNIRTVYFHHFFPGQMDVSDASILKKVKETTPTTGIRQWYAALMDYGTYLKREGCGPNHQSKHYTKQSRFAGSLREIRGAVIRTLASKPQTRTELRQAVADERLEQVLEQLLREGLITRQDGWYALPS